jgi:hypothetical protein
MSVQLITLFVAPCLYCLVKEWQFKRQARRPRDRTGETVPQRDGQLTAS